MPPVLEGEQRPTRFNERANQSYKKPQTRDEKDATAIMFVQMETRHQEQMDNLQRTMREFNERSMKVAENQIIQMKEAMMAITKQQSARPILAQLVLLPPTA